MSRQSIFVAFGATLGVSGLALLVLFSYQIWPGVRPESQLEELKADIAALAENLNQRLAVVEQDLKQLSSRSASPRSADTPEISADNQVADLEAMQKRIADLELWVETRELHAEEQEEISRITTGFPGLFPGLEDDTPPLHGAVRKGDAETAKQLVADGADVNSDWDGWTPIRHAVERDKRELAAYLIAQGADVNAEDPDGDTALGDAALFGNAAMARLLLEQGRAEIDAKNKRGFTPLYRAAMHGHRDAAELLLQSGADLDTEDNEHRTPLFAASEGGHIELVKLLLAWGAYVNVEDSNGDTPLTVAQESGHTELAEVIRQSGGR